jgi:cytidylate kinase
MASDRGVPLVDGPQLKKILDEFSETVRWEHETARLYVGVDDVTPRLNSVEAGNGASSVAKMPLVRDALMPLQRKLSLSAPRGAIVDGRDIGTVIFPDADIKIFMTASLEQRARRRLKQLETSGTSTDLSHDDIMRAIALRDDQDSQRDSAPMRKADDAIVFDTSDMDIDQAIASLKDLIRSKGLA